MTNQGDDRDSSDRCLLLHEGYLGIRSSTIFWHQDLSLGCDLSMYCLVLNQKNVRKKSISLNVLFSLFYPSLPSALLITHDGHEGSFLWFTLSKSVSFRN